MSALADQVLVHLEQQALAAGLPLEEFDPFLARSLELPVAALYAYLRVCFAAERWQLLHGDQQSLPGTAEATVMRLFGGEGA